MGSVIGTEPKPFEWKEKEGLIRVINPNRVFDLKIKKHQKNENEKGTNGTIRGPPFHFQIFDRSGE